MITEHSHMFIAWSHGQTVLPSEDGALSLIAFCHMVEQCGHMMMDAHGRTRSATWWQSTVTYTDKGTKKQTVLFLLKFFLHNKQFILHCLILTPEVVKPGATTIISTAGCDSYEVYDSLWSFACKYQQGQTVHKDMIKTTIWFPRTVFNKLIIKWDITLEN